MSEYRVSKNKEEEAQRLPDKAWHLGREWGIAAADITYSKPYPENEKKIKDLKEKMQKDFFDNWVFFHEKIPDPALTQLLRGFDSGFESETKSKKDDDLRDLCP